MRKIEKNSKDAAITYAMASDFCRIFTEEMSGLYQLSYLLTGDSALAEQCFVGGLEDCSGSNRVFKEWARSWAKRTVIQNAIRLLRPSPAHSGSLPGRVSVGEPRPANHGNLL